MTLVEFLEARIAEDEMRPADERASAECLAKRRIVDWEKRYRTTVEKRGEIWAHRATGNLRALAAIYATHPDYEMAWSFEKK
jgi:hypothetical protein